MNIFYRICAILFIAIVAKPGLISAQAPIDQYLFESSVVEYQPVTGGFLLGNTSTDDQVFIDSNNTAGAFSPQTGAGFYIGFPFTFGTRVFTHIGVSADGTVKLGTGNFTIRRNTLSMSSITGTDTADYNNLLLIHNSDLQAQAGASLRIVRQGTPGNRVCVIQWENYKGFGESFAGDVMNFQIRLNEANMSVVYHFGAWVRNTTSLTGSLGLRGDNRFIFHNRVIRLDSNASWQNSRRTNNRSNLVVSSSSNIPVNGLRYEFFFQPPAPNNMAASGLILSPSIGLLCKPSAPSPIGIKFRNAGTDPQSTFQVGYVVNNGTPVIENVNLTTPLAPGASDSLIFTANPINLTQQGAYTIKAFVFLASETPEYRNNDTVTRILNIIDTLSVPTIAYTNLSQAIANGFRTAIGNPVPNQVGSSRWSDGLVGTTPTFSVSFPTGTIANPTVLNDWFINGPYVAKPDMDLIFRVAARPLSGNITPVLGDDEVSIVFSNDCGETWNSLFSINQSSVASGNITTALKAFEVPLSAVTGNFLLAVRAKTNTPNTSGVGYSIHFTDFKIKIGTEFDLKPVAFAVPDTISDNCGITRANLRMTVQNLGSNAVSNFTAAYRVGAGPLVSKNITLNPPLASGQKVDISFVGTQGLTVAAGNSYRITAHTSAAQETFFTRQNDTIRTVLFMRNNTPAASIPDSNRFDTQIQSNNWFVDNTNPFSMRFRPQRGILNSGALSGILNVSNNLTLAVSPKYGPIQNNTKLRFFYRFLEEVNSNQGAQFNAGDSIVLRASGSCGLSGKSLYRIDNQSHIPSLSYIPVIVDLAEFAGQSLGFSLSGLVNRLDFAGARFEIDNFFIGEIIITGNEDEIVSNDRFAMYPNPAKDKLHVELFNQAKTASKIEILDLHGRALKQIALDGFNTRKEISMAGLSSGVYLVKVHFGQQVSTQKLLITK
jgi:hypothetical protein